MRLSNLFVRKHPLQDEYATLGISLKGRSPKDVSHAELDSARKTQLKELYAVRREMPEEAMKVAVDDKLRQVNEAHARIKNPERVAAKAAALGPIPMPHLKESAESVAESTSNKIDIVFKKPEKTVFGSWRPVEGKRLLLADMREGLAAMNEGSVLETAAKAGAKGKGGLAIAAAAVAAVGGLGVAEYNATLNAEARKANWQSRVAMNDAAQGRAV